MCGYAPIIILPNLTFSLALSVTICTTFSGPILSIVLSNNLYILVESVDSLLASIEPRNILIDWRIHQNIDDHFAISCRSFVLHNGTSKLCPLHFMLINNFFYFIHLFFKMSDSNFMECRRLHFGAMLSNRLNKFIE